MKKICDYKDVSVNSWWQRRQAHATRSVRSPATYFIASALSLVCSLMCVWNAYFSIGTFWPNLNSLLLTGSMALLFAFVALLQIKIIRNASTAPVFIVFLIAYSTYLYQYAKNQTVGLLHRYFSSTYHNFRELSIPVPKSYMRLRLLSLDCLYSSAQLLFLIGVQ